MQEADARSTTEEPARLLLEAVAKNFADVHAVRSVDLALAPGEFLSLLGPSGCGKSTTLSMIAGFEEPSGGTIRIDGQNIGGVSPGRRKIGLVFQDYAVFSRLTVHQNLSFGLEAQRVRRSERTRRVDRIAAQLDLSAILERRGATLNMSEMQRVALARVLVTEPRLLLLDEPMSNLDSALRATLRTELKLLQKSLNQTVLYVTHDQVEAMAMSDRIAIMHNGVIEQIGTPNEIYHRPKTRFVAEFIGDPPINLIACSLRNNGGRVAVSTACHGPVELALKDTPPTGGFMLGIRPHDLGLSRKMRDGAAQTQVVFIENLGVEHVLHCRYGDTLIAATAPPGFATQGDQLWLGLDPTKLILIHEETGLVLPRRETHDLA